MEKQLSRQAKKLRVYRIQNDYTIAEMEKITGINRCELAKLEKGTILFNRKIAETLTDKLGISFKMEERLCDGSIREHDLVIVELDELLKKK